MLNNNFLVIGFFDGIHQGHLQLFKTAVNDFSILTLKNLPNKNHDFLYPFNERVKQLQNTNAHKIYWLDIQKHNMSGEEFVFNVLDKLAIKGVIVGEDFKFGNDHCGIDLLKKHYPSSIFLKRTLDASRTIRENIRLGNLKKANQELVYPYYRTGMVIKGQQQGHWLGFPTANLTVDKTLVPMALGSYSTTISFDNQMYHSVSFVGKSKTMDQKNYSIETHAINFTGSLYGKTIKVVFHQYLRTPSKFESVLELKNAIKKDIEKTKEWFNNETKR
ncbi:riboflavin biosynthesis protein RibF [[Mycoplasma] testudinis]|uniref:riboflavin biosynthesis protein RibF n=1 Tax=[Mycoplasma] testudinis TaxID=33924 RepID=UPI00047F8A93|nr:riboflavin biosynthesis protein RibF [[Mycoplasma] testudinis]